MAIPPPTGSLSPTDAPLPTEALRVLLLEDSPDDALLLQAELEAAGYDVRAEVVDTRAAFVARLGPEVDVILADHSLPQFDALQALELVRDEGLDIPFIIVSGAIDEGTAVEAMRRGAADYLLKDRLARLVPAVRQALLARQNRREKEEAFEALRAREAFNRSVLTSLSAHIAVLDRTGTIVSVNEAWTAFARRNGCTRMEGVGPGTNYLDVCRRAAGDPFASLALAGIEAVLGGRREPFLLEYPCHGSKEQRWFLMRVTPLAGGSEPGAVVAHEDISERRLAEESVRRSEARYRLLAEHVTDVICRIAPDGTCLYVSPSCEPLLGYTPRELVGRSVFDFAHPEERDLLREKMDAVRIGSFDPRTTYRARRKDGTYVWLEANSQVVLGGDGELVTVLRDMTERRRAREALKASEARWRGLVEYHPDPILLSQEGQILYLNPAGCRFLGVSEEEVAGVPLTQFVVPEVHAELAEQIRAVLQGERIAPKEYTIRIASGEKRIVESYSVQVVYQGESCVQSVVRDVTERREYEARLIEAKERAEEMARMKSTFLDNMSHEIRTPLTGILGYSDLLVEETEGEVRDLAKTIWRGGQRLLALLDSVMELVQLESRDLRFQPLELDLVDEVERLLPPFRQRADRAGLYLCLEAEAAPLHATLDRTALARILHHLLDNAVKYTRQGGITVALRRAGDEVEVEVRDTGIGISAGFLGLVFREFQQESEGLSREYEGVGVGLSIAKGLVETMGGEIEVESEKGVGTAFTVRLPVYQSAIPPSAS